MSAAVASPGGIIWQDCVRAASALLVRGHDPASEDGRRLERAFHELAQARCDGGKRLCTVHFRVRDSPATVAPVFRLPVTPDRVATGCVPCISMYQLMLIQLHTACMKALVV